jgi:spermidine/putrescine transport system permease protein
VKKIPGSPTSLLLIYSLYIIAFFWFLFVPLVINGALAFNDDDIPSFPWRGATLSWFYSSSDNRVGIFNDPGMMAAIIMSLKVATFVTAISLVAGVTSAFIFIRENFKGKHFLYFAMLAPLVIPGVILGISMLAFFHWLGDVAISILGREIASPIVKLLQPGFFIVTLGQFCFVGTTATLVVAARLRHFPVELEEAAMDLGSNRLGAIFRITLPHLFPALTSAGAIAFLLSFENFATTLFLIGAEPTLPIFLFSRLRFSITPEINAISVILMVSTSLLGFIAIAFTGRKKAS